MSVLSFDDMHSALAEAPFPADVDMSRAHLFFHLDPDSPGNIEGLEPEEGDNATLVPGRLAHYLQTPDGMSQSRLAELVSRRLKDKATARNLRTCKKMLELAET